MPLYEYQCESCGNRFERIQRFSDPPIDACPSCSGPVRKLLSSPAIQFKGSGWYITDYARKSADSGASKDSKDSGKKDTGASSTSDSSSASTSTPASSTTTKAE